MKTIIVPTDFFFFLDKALRYAANISKKNRCLKMK